ncbi:hypothetical protein CKX96_13600 [Staphylococcus argenteus]|nr:hypothetical protein CJ017_12945 [Staphylococcus argenteus]ATZ88276.1 hypothetical protein CKO49_12935 [Staphylococcus argenteus]KAA0796070.1 hypothetical protein DVU64_13730 [Staphylococcus argenteus]MZG25764.1 hypothetical protein [Staphylococcus argenteus]PSH05899.1 hypothetical protein CKX96_13600 [Staphylococcus argenteus]
MIIMRGYNERYCIWTNTTIQCDYFKVERQGENDAISHRLTNNTKSNIFYFIVGKYIALYNSCSRYENILILSEHSKKTLFNRIKTV